VEVRFNLTLEDISAFWRYVRARRHERAHTTGGWIFAGISVVILIVVLSVTHLWERVPWTSSFIVVVYTFVGTVAFGAGVNWLVEQGNARRNFKAIQAKRLVNNVTASISPEHFSYSTEVSSVTFNWPLIEDVGQIDEHVVILLTKEDGFVIPWRAFDSRAAALTFLETAQRYCQSP
jgi:hypothetical protein